ncbi:GNAT family N-acetyltransferase [Marinomonas rhizomae]|uniref:GNAT family acetyltransferase n=1 Tax=Marinomonas rhizomae TaxID=491948 RepID=A0A366JFC3_9GAMM|nr:GNAT family N-acetyltransferase [Marinomonas rhizomae]RBP84558.1 GNAT family acetyltransferase [Marinomonas rhizomae]RNF75237.1 GNAT family N-acetyltransferase [Marinomonas rhizomae]
MIKVRSYQANDAEALWYLFFSTVRTVNARDYSQVQIEAWAPEGVDMSVWQNKMTDLQPVVAELDNVVVGYCDLQPDGLIDHFFCHHEYQRQGVGRALMNYILHLADERGVSCLYSHVSITAKPFFERFGFSLVNEQRVLVREQELTNFVMEKRVNKHLEC